MADLFEKAARRKLRFDTRLGALSVEDLWDLPLRNPKPGATTLDSIAVALHKELKETAEVSFVVENPRGDEITKLKFDIVLHVIEVRKAEESEAALKRANAERKQQLLEIVSRKENQELEGKPLEELREILAGM